MAFTDASDLSDRRKRSRQKQIQDKTWVFHGYIITDQLHADSDSAGALESGLENEGAYSKVKCVLLAHWAELCQTLSDKIKALIVHLIFICNPASLVECAPDLNDASKAKIQIRGFLQCRNTALTALRHLLPVTQGFLCGVWERCENCLSGHHFYEECVHIEIAWIPLHTIGQILRNKHARKEGRRPSRYAPANPNLKIDPLLLLCCIFVSILFDHMSK